MYSKIGGTIEICTDCLMVLANGESEGLAADAPEPMRFWSMGEVTPGDDTEGHFSHSDCEGCGSRWSGDRFTATYWTD